MAIAVSKFVKKALDSRFYSTGEHLARYHLSTYQNYTAAFDGYFQLYV